MGSLNHQNNVPVNAKLTEAQEVSFRSAKEQLLSTVGGTLMILQFVDSSYSQVGVEQTGSLRSAC
jgi:hypothetical protein